MEKSISKLITFLARKSQTYLVMTLDKFNLTAAEQPILMALYHCEGISQEQLTALVGVDKAATARAVKSLEKKGMAIRMRDQQDRRQNRLYLTETAKRLCPSVKSALSAFNAQITEGIDEASLEIACRVLQKMDLTLSQLLGRR